MEFDIFCRSSWIRNTVIKMETTMNHPTLMKKKLYEQFKAEQLACAQSTALDKEKQAIAVAVNLPEDDVHKIREIVIDGLDLEDLNSKRG